MNFWYFLNFFIAKFWLLLKMTNRKNLEGMNKIVALRKNQENQLTNWKTKGQREKVIPCEEARQSSSCWGPSHLGLIMPGHPTPRSRELRLILDDGNGHLQRQGDREPSQARDSFQVLSSVHYPPTHTRVRVSTPLSHDLCHRDGQPSTSTSTPPRSSLLSLSLSSIPVCGPIDPIPYT